MINEWQPTITSSTVVDTDLLHKFAALGREALQTQPNLTLSVNAEEQSTAQPWIKLTEEAWLPTLNALEMADIFPLAIFFTLAEQQLSGWQCGAKNPAIWMFRWLRQNNALPERDLIRQLKKMTDNRYIPYGSVL